MSYSLGIVREIYNLTLFQGHFPVSGDNAAVSLNITSSTVFKDFDHKFVWQLSVCIKKINKDWQHFSAAGHILQIYEIWTRSWMFWIIFAADLPKNFTEYFHYRQIFHKHSVAAWRQSLGLKTSQKSFRGKYSRIQVLGNFSWIFFTWGATLFISRGLTPEAVVQRCSVKILFLEIS